MIKLRTILLSNSFFIFLLCITCIYVLTNICIIKKETSIDKNQTEFYGVIQDISIQDEQVKVKIKIKKEYIIGYMDKKNFICELNDYVKVTGILNKPNKNTIPNLFNYKKYLYNNHIFYIMEIKKITMISKNKNFLYKLKNYLIKRIDTYKSKIYLKLFILGSKEELDEEIYTSFQNNGISHLFCVSGMHVSFLTGVLSFLLKKMKIKEKKRYCFLVLFLLVYLFLTNFSPSILRSVIFFILSSINTIYYFHIKPIHLLLVTLCICLFINPYFVFHIGFLFSFTVTFYLILFANYFNTKNKIKNIFRVSFVSFLAGLPICLYSFFSINFLSVFYNIFFVPFISLLVFPFSLLTFLFPFLDSLLVLLTRILENISIFINEINSMKFSFYKPNLFIVFVYYICITFSLYSFFKNKKHFLIFLFFLLMIHYNYNFIFQKNYIIMIDVAQGDSTLLHINNKNILIDTGGKFGQKNPSYLFKNILSFLKSLGIKKLDYLIITHGDYDHMGESINLVNNIKIENVIFNCGEYNELEKELINVLEKEKINYYSCIKELNIDKYKLYFLNTGVYGNENDNSSVIYLNYNNYKFLFMGDAGIEREKDILEEYNLSDIDFLKIGHHGSNTSSSEEFINSINPKYSLISVGKNNRYGHPKKSVLDTLSESRIYRTDLDGSIEVKLTKKGYRIRTCPP